MTREAGWKVVWTGLKQSRCQANASNFPCNLLFPPQHSLALPKGSQSAKLSPEGWHRGTLSRTGEPDRLTGRSRNLRPVVFQREFRHCPTNWIYGKRVVSQYLYYTMSCFGLLLCCRNKEKHLVCAILQYLRSKLAHSVEK